MLRNVRRPEVLQKRHLFKLFESGWTCPLVLHKLKGISFSEIAGGEAYRLGQDDFRMTIALLIFVRRLPSMIVEKTISSGSHGPKSIAYVRQVPE